MRKMAIFVSIAVIGTISGVYNSGAMNGTNQPPVYAWIGCDGTAVTRTEAGKIVITQVTENLSGCTGPKKQSTHSGSTSIKNEENTHENTASGKIKTQGVILLDLAQKDIVNYRTEILKKQQIQYANAIRSLRVRAGASKKTETMGYLIKNDAVQVDGVQGGWSAVKTGKVVVTDAYENTLNIDTTDSIKGYTATRYLRNATPADLIKIGQADIAYWSDIVHTNVAHLVNVRSHPWYGAPIVATIPKDINMYRIATVDNWSEVQSKDGVLHGFIRSDFLVTDKKQLIEIQPLLK